jgi:hypothetical protein
MGVKNKSQYGTTVEQLMIDTAGGMTYLREK